MSVKNKRLGLAKAVVLSIAIGGMLGIRSIATAAKMTKMQEMRHASPMPNLMMLVMPNAAMLELTKEQRKGLKEWRKGNLHIVRSLTQEIIDTENELRQATLDGAGVNDKKELRDFILGTRGKLIDVRYRCAINMQEILNDKQWEQLMVLRERHIIMAEAANKTGNEIQSFLRVSPMPKLMAIVLMHGHELDLSPEQAQALEDRRVNNMNEWSLLFGEVLGSERRITQEYLDMKDAKELMTEFDEMLAKRHTMAAMTLNCRNLVRDVLNDEQWEKVLRFFKSYI